MEGNSNLAVKSAVVAEGNEDSALVEFNTFVNNIKKELAKYPPTLQVQFVNHLYTDTYERLEAEVNAQKASLTMSEKIFNGLLFKVAKT